MRTKIVGVTVNTPLSKSKIEEVIKPVLKVNGQTPDENGNVEVVGNNGKDGYTPVKGVDYFDGKDGADGKSAYEYAVNGGFLGTVEQFAAKLATKFATPQMYGAKGDGLTDDTAAIQAALDANSFVYIPGGVYMIDSVYGGYYHESEGGIKLKSNQTVVLSENAVLKAIPNSSEFYTIVNIFGVENVTIRGGKVEGDKLDHTGTSGEWGCGISIERSTNITVEGVESFNCWGDSISIGADTIDQANTKNSEKICIYNCKLHDSRRQGISITGGKNVVIRDCEIYNIRGTAPQAGIDIEPNHSKDLAHNITIDSCYIHDTANASIMTYHSDESNFETSDIINGVTISNCKLANGTKFINGSNILMANTTVNGNITVNTKSIVDVSGCLVERLTLGGGNITFNNCDFVNSGYVIVSDMHYYPTSVTDLALFNNCRFTKGNSSDPFIFFGYPSYVQGVYPEKLIKFSSCKIEIKGTGLFSERLPYELILDNCEVVFDNPPYVLFNMDQKYSQRLTLRDSEFVWQNQSGQDYGPTDLIAIGQYDTYDINIHDCKFSNSLRCFYFGSGGNAGGKIRMLNNVLSSEINFGSHKFNMVMLNDLSKIPTSVPTKTSQLTNDSDFLTSIPSEYVTDSELTTKGYLTTSTLPKYTGGVS